MLVAGDLDLSLLEDIEEQFGPPQCESTLKAHQHEHDAAWYASCPCGDVTPVCEARRAKAYRDDGWKCVVRNGSGCTAWHPYADIWWTPVQP